MTVVAAVITAAVLLGWRRRRRARPDGHGPPRRRRGPRGRRRAAVVVTALLAGLVLVALPASAAPLDCKAPPDPDRPGTGLVGSLDPAPIGVGAPGSVYAEVGYAGQVWWTYDVGCGPSAARDPAASTDTWLGNQFFNIAKLVVGGVNWAHYLIERGSGLLQPLDGIVASGTQAMYSAVFTTWAGLALLVLAAILLLLAARGDLSRQAQRAGIALVALVIAAGAYAAPIQWSSALDGVLLDGVTAMQRGFLGQIGAGDANTLPTLLTDQIVYTNWLRGQYGSAEVPQAQADGRDLVRAQAFTKQEVADGQDGQAQAEAKQQQFTAIAERAGDRYSYFQGRQGSRIGAGMLALVQAACIGLFQLMSKILVLVSMLVIRLMVMIAPALAVLALVKPEVLPAALRVGGAALVNTLLVSAMAGLHSLMVIALFRPGSGVDTWLALLVTGVVTVVFWALARPFRRLTAMVSLTRDQLGGVLPPAGAGVFGRMLGGQRGPDRQDGWWSERRATAGGTSGGRRPESSVPARAAEPATTADGGPLRVDSERVGARSDGGDPAAALADRSGSRRALSAGSSRDGDATPARLRTEADRGLYRSVAARTGDAGGPRRPVQAELVDGAPVYRIYRPARPVGSGGTSRSAEVRSTPARRADGGSRADPD